MKKQNKLIDKLLRLKNAISHTRAKVKNEIALISASFGMVDEIKPLPALNGLDAYLFTDKESHEIIPKNVRNTWTRIIVPDFPRRDFSARLTARYFKHQIQRLEISDKYKYLIWADCSLKFQDLKFITSEVKKLKKRKARDRVMMVPHPERKTVFEEYKYITEEIKSGNDYLKIRYENEKMEEQIEFFKRQKWNYNSSLFATTIWMIENHNTLLNDCWNDWWDQNLRFGMMDQLSLPPLFHKHGISPRLLDVNLWKNQYFEYTGHTGICMVKP